MAFIENLPTGVYERDQEGKGYYKVLVVGGRGAQSAELNEIQQIQDSQRSKLTEALFSNGSLISGGFLSQDESTKVITLDHSKAFLQNYIFDIPESTVSPNATGESTIGILLTKKFVTPDEDAELLNPVENTKNYNTRGAIRLQFTYSWAAEPDVSTISDNIYYYPMYSTIDGEIVISSQEQNTEINRIYETIQRYDNDSNGSYITRGMGLYYTEDSGEYHICGVNSGSAHVAGKEVNFPHSETINIRRALDIQNRVSEPISYTSEGDYNLRHTPIASIARVLGVKKMVQRAVTHGNYSGASDIVDPDDSHTLTEIISVSASQNGNGAFSKGSDYVQNGDYIDWSLNGNEPSPGSTYYVTYLYQTPDVTFNLNEDLSSVHISGLEANTTAYVDYSHYLQRIDSVILNSDGTIAVVEGASAEYTPVAQNVSSGLLLSTVLLSYGNEPVFFNDACRVFKNSDLTQIRDTIYDIQYNVAQLDLKTDISSRDPATTRKGMFVDPFYDDDQRDQGIEQNAEIIDSVLLPEREWNIYTVREGADVTLNRSSTAWLINQPYRTKERLINEYLVSTDVPFASISVSPKTYRWTAKFSKVTEIKWATTGRTRASRVAAGKVKANSKWNGLIDFPNYAVWYSPTVSHYNSTDAYKKTGLSQLQATAFNYITTTVASSTTKDISGTYVVPPYSLKVTGSNFNRGETVYIDVDGKRVGSFAATTSGTISATVTTPTGMKSGNKSVKATGATSKATATTTISTIPQSQETKYYEYHSVMYDPIGQTFVNDKNCFLYSVQLIFSAKPASSVELAIMECTGGYPDPTRKIASKVLAPASITANAWTSFVFDAPVYLEENTYYAVTLLSTEASGKVYVAEIGKYDKWNKYWVTKNIFQGGTLVNGSVQYTWTAVQNEDLTFRMAKCVFNTTKTEKSLGTVTIPATKPATQLYLLSDSRLYPGTSVEYSLTMPSLPNNAGKEPIPVSEYTIQELGLKYSGKVTVKANLNSTTSDLTPYVSGDVQLAAATPVYPSNYVTRRFDTEGRNLKVYLDLLEYGTNQITVEYQKSNGNWEALEYNPSNDTQLGNNWVTRTFSKDTGSDNLPTRIRITFNSLPDAQLSSVSLPACANLRVLSNKQLGNNE